MTTLSDAALERLRSLGDAPALDGTRYELLDELGRGGMGAVYRVRDRALGREVALKVVPDVGRGPDIAQRLEREARALARLEHPGIVPVYDAGVLADGRLFYTMKLVRGERLDAHLQRGILLGEALRLFARICEAVAFAHANGVIHRDLKPQNVMLGAFGEVLVLDWGLAKLRDHDPVAWPGRSPPSVRTEFRWGAGDAATRSPGPSDQPFASDRASVAHSAGAEATTRDGIALGTPGYMAPEQASGEVARIDERTDVFALGAILRTMVTATGERPSRALAAIIARASALEPSMRYPRVTDLGNDIARLQDGQPVSAHRENLLERATRLARRHQVAIGLILAYLLMRVALLVMAGR